MNYEIVLKMKVQKFEMHITNQNVWDRDKEDFLLHMHELKQRKLK